MSINKTFRILLSFGWAEVEYEYNEAAGDVETYVTSVGSGHRMAVEQLPLARDREEVRHEVIVNAKNEVVRTQEREQRERAA